MAVTIGFITFIMPLSNVEKYYPGGVEAFKKEHEQDYEFDDYLCKTSAMGGNGMDMVIDFWKSLGAVPTTEENGVRKFKDFCLSEYIFGEEYLPCDWLVFADRYARAWHINDKSKTI